MVKSKVIEERKEAASQLKANFESLKGITSISTYTHAKRFGFLLFAKFTLVHWHFSSIHASTAYFFYKQIIHISSKKKRVFS